MLGVFWDNFKYPRVYVLNAMNADTNEIWTEPFVPDDEIGRRTNSKVVQCRACGLKTMPGTEGDSVHKRGCPHR